MTKAHDLHDLMAQVTAEMSSEYDRIQKRVSEDPGTAGDQEEENWADLLRGWLPAGYHVKTKGRLIGHDGTTTPQIDIVVLKPSYPPKMLNTKLYLAGGVAAAFECKITLRAADITDAIQTAVKCKSLYRARVGTPYKELRSPLVYGLLAHSHEWTGPKATPADNVLADFDTADRKFVDHPRLGLDLICVASLGAWTQLTTPFYDLSWRGSGLSGQVAATSMVGTVLTAEGQVPSVRPVGSFVAGLFQKLAWEDPACRDIADYYRLANLLGNGSGPMRDWQTSVFSNDVATAPPTRFTNGVGYDEWSLALL